MDDQQPQVRNNEAAGRFEITVEGNVAHADYRLRDGVLTMVHTEVPDALEGRGLGGALVRAAVEHARSRKLRLVPQCSYVKGWIDRHPEAQDVVQAG